MYARDKQGTEQVFWVNVNVFISIFKSKLETFFLRYVFANIKEEKRWGGPGEKDEDDPTLKQ